MILGANLVQRFWENVEKSDGCWTWTAGKSHGYGVFAPALNTAYRAHRLAYELEVGPIAEGMEVDHLCRNPSCVRPDHLEPVTHAENCRRGYGFGGRNARKTHCDAGHELDGDNLYMDPKGRRQCKACRAQALREFRLRNGAFGAEWQRRLRDEEIVRALEAGLSKSEVARRFGVGRQTVYRAYARVGNVKPLRVVSEDAG